jgi:hypothetical protein
MRRLSRGWSTCTGTTVPGAGGPCSRSPETGRLLTTLSQKPSRGPWLVVRSCATRWLAWIWRVAFRIVADELKDRQRKPEQTHRLAVRDAGTCVGGHASSGSAHTEAASTVTMGHASSPRRTTSTGGSGRGVRRTRAGGRGSRRRSRGGGPLVRSGYHAGKQLQRAMGATAARQLVASRVNEAPSKMIAGQRSIPQSYFWSRKVSWSPSSS